MILDLAHAAIIIINLSVSQDYPMTIYKPIASLIIKIFMIGNQISKIVFPNVFL